MFRSHATRRFAPWLVGLFVLAQIAGVVPLMAAHTHHVFESKQVVTDDDGVVSVSPRGVKHHHSAADLNDQCCAFHHLAGVLAYALPVVPVSFIRVLIVSLPPRMLIAADPNPPERPPKSLSSI
jgi:hypothetical protein